MKQILIITTLLLATPAVADMPRKSHKTAHFDMVEVNIFYNDWGFPQWAQLVCWDWHRFDRKFHVEYWIMTKDAFEKTPEGEKKHKAYVNELRTKFGMNMQRTITDKSQYKGEFVGGRMYPQKNYHTDKYESRVYNQKGELVVVTANIMRTTHTQYDPERRDRKFHPEDIRRGLKSEYELLEEDGFDIIDFDWLRGVLK